MTTILPDNHIAHSTISNNSIQNSQTRNAEDKQIKDIAVKQNLDQLKTNKKYQKSRSRQHKVYFDQRQKKHKKRDRKQRSRSDSQDNRKQKSRKHKHRKHHNSSDESSSSISRSQRRQKQRKRSRDKKHQKDNKQRHNRDRSLSNSKYNRKEQEEKIVAKQIPKMPQQVPFQEISTSFVPGQRRRRQRSRSPRSYYRQNKDQSDDALFWTSHGWVPKLNQISNASSSAIINTKKMRRFQITNMPLEMGLRSQDINEIVTDFMIKNYLTDGTNKAPILKIDISQADRSVAIQLSSVQQTFMICKLQKIELFKSCICGIIRLGDSMYGSSLVSQAQSAAKAQAAAFAAISILQNKSTKFDYTGGMASVQSSNVLRVVNAVTAYMCDRLSQQEWNQYYEDLVQGFRQHGKVKHSWMVKKHQRMVCAEPGDLFIEYEKKEQAQVALQAMQGRNFDERQLQLYFIPDNIYQNHFKPNSSK